MSDIVIRSESLGKSYLIGHQGPRERYTTLRDAIARQARGVWQSTRRAWRGEAVVAGQQIEEFWALRDVSFEVKQGEVVGIIGRNGAGKSTLLKILSRITEPTEGRVTLRGRVASLLEVGTGFHPELTGRENIFLNGAILGMTRAEIKRKFDEIVAFAEADKFLDTPVKRYSSGMQVRLAFAVAAHLEPEILVVDEVLAVGDAQFQRKCLGKMHRVAGEGRTVLFVSHNIGAVQQLCGRGLLLNSGLLENDGSIDATIKCYMRIMDSNERTGLAERVDRAGKGLSRISHLAIRDESGALSLMSGSAAFFEFEVTRWLPRLDLRFTIYDGRGTPVFSTSSPENGSEDTANGNRRFTCEMRNLLLRPGSYRVNCALHSSGELQDHVEAAAFFEVESGLIDGQPATNGAGFGSVLLPHRWTLSRMQVQLP